MATPVVVIRPQATLKESLGDVLYGFVLLALKAWFVMLLWPVVLPGHPGYWHSVAVTAFVGMVLPGDSSRLWTKAKE